MNYGEHLEIETFKYSINNNYKMFKKYPLKSSPFQIKTALSNSKRTIKKNLKKNERKALSGILSDFVNNNVSKTKYSTNGMYTPKRKKLHNKLINRRFKDKRTIDKKDPDVYILGGIASSGKSKVLSKRIPERTINLDSDSYKKDLSKIDKSPIKRFPLLHSAYLHEESSDLYNMSIKRAIKEKRDVTLDATLANKTKAEKQIKRFKKAGYDVHLLGTQKATHKAIHDATGRFIVKGRYVPPSVIADKGNQTNANVMSLRKKTDSHIIFDTNYTFENKRKPILVSKSKTGLKKNYRDP